MRPGIALERAEPIRSSEGAAGNQVPWHGPARKRTGHFRRLAAFWWSPF